MTFHKIREGLHVDTLIKQLHIITDLNEKELLLLLSILMLASAAIVASVLLLFRFPVPYGRYSSQSMLRKIAIPARIAWFLQELPSLVVPLIALATVASRIPLENFLVLAMFIGHYSHRTLLYPFLIKGGKPLPIHLLLLGAVFTTWNGYIQGFYHLKYANYSPGYMWTPRGAIGLLTFVSGLAINCHSDHVLRGLRRDSSDQGYKIPHGGFFEYVSGANFFGEILEWFGYAVYATSLPAWAFAVFTLANLIPRAIDHHRWYLKKFEDYPKTRRAIIPFLL